MSQQPRTEDRMSARRKLVWGVFGAPAALVVPSASALSASSATACLARRSASATMPQPKTLTADQSVYFSHTSGDFFYYRLWVLQDGGGTADSFWVKGADLVPFNRNGQIAWLGSTAWQQLDGTTGAAIGQPVTIVPGKSGFTLVRGSRWFALRVDVNGRVDGIGNIGLSPACSGSCWTSFATSTTPTA